MTKRLIVTVAILIIAGVCTSLTNKLCDDLSEILNEKSTGQELLPIFVIITEQLDPDELYRQVKHLDKTERRKKTIETLKAFSEETQHSVRELIIDLGTEGQIRRPRFLWITNIIGMRATEEAISGLSVHPDVAAIHYDPMTPALDFIEPDNQSFTSERHSRRNNERISNNYRNISYNVELINAPEVWDLGYTGEGVLVAVLDTGINYNHHDIRDRMWEHPDFPNHGYNFVDNNYDTMDNHRHGTHCAGTVAGDGTSGNRTGVAPGSTIMALKVLGDDGAGEYQMVWHGMQFAAEYGADVMSVSLGWMDVHNSIRAIFRNVAQNVLSAGVIVAKSAGNRGNAGITVPGDCPPPRLSPDQTLIGGVSAVFTVGATDRDDQIAGFSSRGPTSWQNVQGYNDYPLNPGMGLIKPDITAPGVDVLSLSHSNITGYTPMSGTSMATPAVAGVAALLLSKNPHLIPEDIAAIIEETALPLSETKSNIYGSGRVNALAALSQAYCITVQDVTFTDDNNNIPEYGELVDISVTLYNFQVEDAEDMVGTLTTDDQYIEIINGREEFGELEPDSTATYDEAFRVSIADYVPDGHVVNFRLNIRVDEDREWNRYFTMKVNAPVLSTSVVRIHDPLPEGNNNGFIDAGEELMIYLPIVNKGNAESQTVSLSVSTDSDLINIISISDSLLAPIRAEETFYPQIRIAVSENADYGDLLPFTYHLETGEYQFEGDFSLVVGSLLSARLGRGEAVNDSEAASPINTFFRSLRSQTVYTRQELNDTGIYGSYPIDRLGYFVVDASQHSLTNFLVRMKHTEAEDASQHLDGPYQTVYQVNNYVPQQGYWDILTLTEPFVWNGRDNLLIDTAFAPVGGFSAEGRVRIYDMDNGFRYTRYDHPDQTNAVTTSISRDKPQIMLLFDAEDAGSTAPRNLTARIEDLGISLEWDAPTDERTGCRISRGQLIMRSDSKHKTRNPDGYNVYKNGRRINTELVTETEYLDTDVDTGRIIYYFVTAVYEDYESEPSNIVDVRFQVPAPQFSPDTEIHYDGFLVTISCELDNADIYYRFDDNEPTADDYLYEHPFIIDYHTVLSAKAFIEGWQDSEKRTINYYVIHPAENLRGESKVNAVKLKWEEPWSPEERGASRDKTGGRSRRKTVNNRAELQITRGSYLGYNVYRSVSADSFVVINESLLETEQFIDDNLPSGELAYYITTVYEVGESKRSNIVRLNGTVAVPQFSHEPGDYDELINLSLKTSTPEAVIYYTVDGTNPTDSSLVFSENYPIEIDRPMTVKAFAVRDGWQDSEIAEGEFIVVSIGAGEHLRLSTELHTAYPNPFNPAATIKFTLAEPGHVNITVYNIKGQRLKTIVDENMERGRHHIVWHGDDYSGNRLGSGVYLYRMSAFDYTKTRKILMLK